MKSTQGDCNSQLLAMLKAQEYCSSYSKDYKNRLSSELLKTYPLGLEQSAITLRANYPLHLAAECKASITVIQELVRLFPDQPSTMDWDNKLPVHYSLLTQAPCEVVRILFADKHASKAFYESMSPRKKKRIVESPLITAVKHSTGIKNSNYYLSRKV